MKKSQFIKWALFIALSVWGMFSFLVVIGDDSPYNPLPLVQFFLMKIGGLASLYFTVCLGIRLYDMGLLPDGVSQFIDETEE